MISIEYKAPTRPLSINESNRLHWAERRRRLKPYENATINAFRKLDKKQKDLLKNHKIKISVTITFAKNARRDPHNYVSTVCKVIVDALIFEGLAKDDTSNFITVDEPVIRIDKDEKIIIDLIPLNKLGV